MTDSPQADRPRSAETARAQETAELLERHSKHFTGETRALLQRGADQLRAAQEETELVVKIVERQSALRQQAEARIAELESALAECREGGPIPDGPIKTAQPVTFGSPWAAPGADAIRREVLNGRACRCVHAFDQHTCRSIHPCAYAKWCAGCLAYELAEAQPPASAPSVATGADETRPAYETTDAQWLRTLAHDLVRGRYLVLNMPSEVEAQLPLTLLYAWTPQRLREIAALLEARPLSPYQAPPPNAPTRD